MTQILVVDDVPAMAEQYAYDLKRAGGYQVAIALRGEEALDLLTREPIDCVVLDLEMPGMDGFDFLRRCRQQGCQGPRQNAGAGGGFEHLPRSQLRGAASQVCGIRLEEDRHQKAVVDFRDRPGERLVCIGHVAALPRRC